MAGPKVLATGPLDAYSETVLGRFGDYVVAPDMKPQTLAALMDEDVIALAIRGTPPIGDDLMARAPNLTVMGRTGVGFDNVDVAAATRRGIPLVYAPGAGARAVAEGALTFMLALSKLVVHWDRELKAGRWTSRFAAQGRDLDGATLGIVGFGRIGRILAEMARPFAMTVLACDPMMDEEKAKALGVEAVDLDDLLARSDFVSLHCPMSPETRGLVDRDRIARMKPGAYLVNTSRGGVIDSLDILDEALGNGHLAGVALDVFDPAPPDVSHPLFRRENVLCSPHSMATTRAAMTRIFRSMADDMAARLEGRRPIHVVNPETLG